MKLMNALTACLIAIATTASAQTSRMMMPAVSSPSVSDEGTELGANSTLSASGIALGNRVKMRGFVDFRYDYTDLDNLATGDDDARFRTAADVDFLFDFSPVTGEVHLAASSGGVNLEQAFLRYNFNQDFSLTAGRQLTVLGFEKDESPNMYQTSYAYLTDVSSDLEGRGGRTALESFVGVTSFRETGAKLASGLDTARQEIIRASSTLSGEGFTNTANYIDGYTLGGVVFPANPVVGVDNEGEFELPGFRRNYVDGIRLNFNNGQFGFVAGLHNGYFTDSDHLNDGNIGLDIAASVMIIPGLEFRLGFGYENNDAYNNAVSGYNAWASGFNSAVNADLTPALSTHDFYTKYASNVFVFPESDDISQLNFLLSYQTGGLTLAFEWDLWNVYVIDMWNLMFLANYQFNDVFGLTFRYSHEDFEADVPGGGEGSSNRFTIGPMFSVTDNLTVGIEYSHAELDSTNTGDTSVDELYAETIFSF
jgi:hypothetical protein